MSGGEAIGGRGGVAAAVRGRLAAWLAARVAEISAWNGPRAALEAERARWDVWVPVAFGSGIAVYFALPAEPAFLTAAALLLGALALRIGLGGRFWLPLATALLLTAAAGFLAATIRTEWTRAPVLSHRLGHAEVVGRIELVEPRPARGQRLTLKVTRIAGLPRDETPNRVRIRTLKTSTALRPGDLVRLKASLAPPAAPALPGDYDFGRTAWYWGLGASGFAMAAPEVLEGPEPGLRQSASLLLERLRQAISARIMEAIPGETGALASSLITGERGAIPEATNDAFRDSGLLHILSISGLHMVVMAGAVFVSIRVLLALIPAIALRHPTKKWAAAAAALAAFGYLLLSGASVATVRAYLMIAIMFLAVLLDRPALAMRNVAISALVILAVTPESLLDVGFQMSFASVVALVSAYEVLRRREEEADAADYDAIGRMLRHLGSIVLSTVIASLAVAPFALYHFHKSQQFALIANLAAIPICNLIVMPAGLVTLLLMPFGLEEAPLAIMAVGIDWITAVARWVADLPGAVVRFPAISQTAFALMVAGGLWLTLWERRWRWLGLAPIAAGLVAATSIRHYDLIVGEGGSLVAARQANGTLAVTSEGARTFLLTRWLEQDGDARSADEARRATAFRCDGEGCTAKMRGLVIAVARHPAAFRDDCRKADILIASAPPPRDCPQPKLILKRSEIRRAGTLALTFHDDPDMPPSIESAEAARGHRPWSTPRDERASSSQGRQAASRAERNTTTRKPQADIPQQSSTAPIDTEAPADDDRADADQ